MNVENSQPPEGGPLDGNVRPNADRYVVTWVQPFCSGLRAVHEAENALRAAVAVPAQGDDALDARAEIERLKIRGEAYENAYRIAYQATYQSHSGHWDKTGQHGAGCPECIYAREARENCDAALQNGLQKLAERAALASQENDQ